MTPFLNSAGAAVCIAVAVQCFTVGYLAPKLPREVCRPMVQETREVTLPARPVIYIENADGAIHLNTHTKDAVELSANIRAYTVSAEQHDSAAAYVSTLVDVVPNSDVLRIVSEPDARPDGLDLRIDYTVLVPEDTAVRIEGQNGNVYVNGRPGALRITGNTTDIVISGATGPVVAKSNIGRIRVNNAQNRTRLETVNGNIHATMDGGTLLANSTNGNIFATLSNGSVTDCELNSLNGGITLILSPDCSASVEAQTERGVVRTDMLLGLVPAEQKRREVRGTIGPGATRLSLQTVNGNIMLTRSGA